MQYEVTVELKKEVLDVEGRAILEALNRSGAKSLKDVTVSKRYVIEMDSKEKNAADYIEKLAKEYLANPVSETFKIKKM
jgi:phosphoribosylformylglycinamidine synthase